MQVLYYATIGLILFAAATTVALQRKIDTPPAVVTASAQVDQYRMFMYVAAQYMNGYAGGVATIPWSTLKTVATAPSGAVGMNMPATWKVVAAADSSWVACTPMDERALGALQQLATAGGKSLNQTQIGANNFVVIGTATDTAKAAQCN